MGVIVHELMLPTIAIRAVQMAEPTRMHTPATTVIRAENEGIQVWLRVYSTIPLGGITVSEPSPKMGDRDGTDLIRAINATVAPLSKKRRAT